MKKLLINTHKIRIQLASFMQPLGHNLSLQSLSHFTTFLFQVARVDGHSILLNDFKSELSPLLCLTLPAPLFTPLTAVALLLYGEVVGRFGPFFR